MAPPFLGCQFLLNTAQSTGKYLFFLVDFIFFFFLPPVVVKQCIDKTNRKMKRVPVLLQWKGLLPFCSRHVETKLNYTIQSCFAFWSLLSLQEEGCVQCALSPALPAPLLHVQVRKSLPESVSEQNILYMVCTREEYMMLWLVIGQFCTFISDCLVLSLLVCKMEGFFPFFETSYSQELSLLNIQIPFYLDSISNCSLKCVFLLVRVQTGCLSHQRIEENLKIK